MKILDAGKMTCDVRKVAIGNVELPRWGRRHCVWEVGGEQWSLGRELVSYCLWFFSCSFKHLVSQTHGI